MNELDIYRSMGGMLKQLNLGDVMATNAESGKYGLVFSNNEAEELVNIRNQAIYNHGRIELGIEVVVKIVTAFCRSVYINKEEYAGTIGELIDIFYQMKNETEDKIGDDELIAMMQEYYNGSCRGSLDLLRNREMQLFVTNFRRLLQEKECALQGSEAYNDQ